MLIRAIDRLNLRASETLKCFLRALSALLTTELIVKHEIRKLLGFVSLAKVRVT